jgi:hypothetical protein
MNAESWNFCKKSCIVTFLGVLNQTCKILIIPVLKPPKWLQFGVLFISPLQAQALNEKHQK